MHACLGTERACNFWGMRSNDAKQWHWMGDGNPSGQSIWHSTENDKAWLRSRGGGNLGERKVGGDCGLRVIGSLGRAAPPVKGL
jgi:hypothetical protein